MSDRGQKRVAILYGVLLIAAWIYLDVARRKWLYYRPYNHYADCESYFAAGFAFVLAALMYFSTEKGSRELWLSLMTLVLGTFVLYGFFWLTRISITLVP